MCQWWLVDCSEAERLSTPPQERKAIKQVPKEVRRFFFSKSLLSFGFRELFLQISFRCFLGSRLWPNIFWYFGLYLHFPLSTCRSQDFGRLEWKFRGQRGRRYDDVQLSLQCRGWKTSFANNLKVGQGDNNDNIPVVFLLNGVLWPTLTEPVAMAISFWWGQRRSRRHAQIRSPSDLIGGDVPLYLEDPEGKAASSNLFHLFPQQNFGGFLVFFG